MSDGESIDLGDIVDYLRPHIKDMVQTIAIAGSAKTDEKGNVVPGDVKAASIGLELISKYLSGKGSDKASRLLKELTRIREAALDSGAESLGGADNPD